MSITTLKRNCIALILSALVLFPVSGSAQTNWNLAEPTDGSGAINTDLGRGICTDANGNVYIIGVFNGTGDFDLNSSQVSTYTSAGNDGFVASYDKNGNFRWQTIISGSGADFVAPSGAICTNGTNVWFTGSVNIGGSPQVISSSNTVTVAPTGGAGSDIIVGKLACSNGAVNWAVEFGGSSSNDGGQGICVDPGGCCYVIGGYGGTFTLNGHTAPASGGSGDLFVAKFNPGGGLLHVSTGGSSSGVDMISGGGSICYVPGATPAIVAGGSCANGGTITYGAFSTPSSGSVDGVLLELDTTLNFTNALVLGTTALSTDEVLGVTYDPFSGGVYMVGYYNGASITLPGTATMPNSGVQDIMIARYSVAGNNFIWAAHAGGAGDDRGEAITADGQGGILISGNTGSAPCTFSGSVSVSNTGGGNDIYVAHYNTSGTPIWALAAGGTGDDQARAVASYVQTTPFVQNVYITGNFQNSVTFNGTTLVAEGTGSSDYFLARINDLAAPLSATQSQVNLTCNGVCTGSATVVASGGTPPYTYSWSPSGGSGATASSLCATNYTVTITDAATTSITKTFSLTQPPAIIVTPVSQTNVSCNGGSNGAAQVTASGGTGTLTYNWTPGNPTGDGTGSVTGLTAQTWTCTVTDANSCTATRTFNITAPSALVVNPVSQTNVSCFGGSNGAASVSVSGGAGGYTYNWTPGNPTGDGTGSVTGLTAQTWTCTVTDANGCTGTRTFNITQPTSPVSGTTVVTNVACFGGSTGAINLTPTGGSPGYTFNWLPSGPTTEDRTGLSAGTYTVQITDANGCTGTVNATVTQPTSPVSGTTVVTNVACFGGSTGAINLTPSGGSPGYTFNWLPSGPTTEDRTSLSAGTYTVQITDANGCTGTATATITQPPAVSGTTTVTNVSCSGGSNGSATVTATGGTGSKTYSWAPSGGTGATASGLAQGTYTVTITDANGCTGTATATITQPAAVSGTTTVTNVSCFGGSNGSATVTAAGGTGSKTYSWAPSGGTGATASGLAPGTYTVTITDANSCTGTATATITQPTSPVSGTTTVTNVSCFGGSNGSATVTAAGGTGSKTYSWAPSGGTAATASGLAQGTYTVTITDANGCTGTATATITQPTSPVSGTTTVTNVSCFGGSNGSATVTAAGGTGSKTYSWAPSGGTGATASGLAQGTYTVTITDANGCTGTATAAITQPTAVSGTTTVTNVSCFGGSNGSATVTAAGGTGSKTYSWAPSGGTGATASGLAQGTYTVTITDANGCTGTATATVTQPAAITATTSHTDVSCNGSCNGTATVTATGGTGSKTYSWAPGGGTAATASGLCVGTYTCTITDANGCSTTQTVTITEPSVLTVTVTHTDASCNGTCNGTATAAPGGGTAPYTYSWAPAGGTGITASGLCAGTYTCTVTDANGCTAIQTVIIGEPAAITATISHTEVSCNDSCDGSATVTATGGTGSKTYSWAPSGGTGVTASGLCAGTYTCTITDANGCSVTQTVTITEPPVLVVTISGTNVSCNGVCDGTASATVSGGTPAYTYMWAPGGQAGTSLTGLCAGTYTCSVTDSHGCVATQAITVTEPAVLIADATATSILCNGGTATVTVTASGGSTAYTGTGTFTATAGTPSYTVTDANGCSAVATVTITEPAAITGMQTLTVCAGQTVTVGGNTYDTTGVYTDVLPAANSCDSTVTTNLTVLAPIAATQTLTVCAGQTITVGGNTYDTTGVYTDVLPAANSCDSTVTTNLTVLAPIAATQTLTVCAGQTVTVGSNTYDTTGVYTDVIPAMSGCDSTVTTNLTVLPLNATSQTMTICAGDSVVVGSMVHTASGTYTDTLTAMSSCDSIVTTNLTVLPANMTTNTLALCAGGSVTVGSHTYDSTGVYTDVFTAANGCDSTIVTDLTINMVDVSVTVTDPVATANAGGAVYQWLNCTETGNTTITGETNQSFTAMVNGNYAVAVTQNGCTDTSACVTIIVEGISEQAAVNGFSVYPNPASSAVTVEIKHADAGMENTITLYDAVGKLVYSTSTTAEKAVIDMDKFSKGIYFIRLQNANGAVTQKITKQ